MNRYFIITLFAAFLSHSVNSQSSIDESKVSNAVNLIKNSPAPSNQTETEISLNSSILNDVIITGAVFDNETKEPLEYATVSFFDKRENKIKFEHIKVYQTLPFAIFLFVGVIITILVKGNLFSFISNLF